MLITWMFDIASIVFGDILCFGDVLFVSWQHVADLRNFVCMESCHMAKYSNVRIDVYL